MKKMILVVLISLVFVTSKGVVYAHSEDSLRDVVADSLYGGLAGALVGVATLAFVGEPEDHTDNIKVGAGIGMILGTVYGTMKVTRSVAKWDDGKMTVGFPAIQLDISGSTEKHVPLWKLNILELLY
jgi:hypothetical protein